MGVHRLDYGSIRAGWHHAPVGGGLTTVSVAAQCICGHALYAAGSSFVEAMHRLEDEFRRHAIEAEPGGDPHMANESDGIDGQPAK
jgi:hypothetical protein